MHSMEQNERGVKPFSPANRDPRVHTKTSAVTGATWSRGHVLLLRRGRTVGIKRRRMIVTIAETFHDHWIEDENGCWIWQRACKGKEVANGGGYGCLRIEGKLIGAHCYSYEMEFGPIPEGMQILHSCHNTKCVNPMHMRTGTNDENQLDSAMAGRRAKKLGPRRVRIIRRAVGFGISQQSIATRYNVDRSTVRDIALGRTWKHVN